MAREPNKRPRRNPMTSEEVLHIIAHKKKRELVTLYKLKKSRIYKIQNVFNVACIFIYLEIVFCYFGPCHYQKHFSERTQSHYGLDNPFSNKLSIAGIDISDVNGKLYKLVIESDVDLPAGRISFLVGKDFLLQKELKVFLENSESAYRIFAASPVLFLCIFASFMSFFGFILNLNENAYTLSALTALNCLALFAVLVI